MASSAPPKPEELQQLSQEWDGRVSENNHVEPSARTKIAASVMASLLVIAFIVCFGFFIYTRPSERYGIILFIGDGFGPASATLARTMLNRSLSLDPYLVGTVRTFSASSLITDSAAAATAYACGEKTNNAWVSVLPDGTPCRTLLEAAQDAGWRVGLIATTDLTDATPAAFSAHSARGNMSEIAAQQLQHKVDVMIGGGKMWFAPLLPKAAELSVTLTADWLDVKNKRVKMPFVAALTDGRMPYMIDRPADTPLPTLEACFNAAIEYLTSDDKPFFLMVEGSRIDHAGHGNDPAAQWMEVGAFEAAFDAAVKWAHTHTGVAVVSTADHETGGLTLGRDPALFTKPADYAWDPSVIRAVKASGERMNQLLGSTGWSIEEVQAIMVEYANIQITEEEYIYMLNANVAGAAANGITRVISHRAGLDWTTLGHTGIDVNLYTAGAAPRFHGSVDNTAVGRALAALHKFEIGRVHSKK